jgi:hypothetical protein
MIAPPATASRADNRRRVAGGGEDRPLVVFQDFEAI